MASTYVSLEELQNMQRRDLQQLAKSAGIKANLKNSDMIQQLHELFEEHKALKQQNASTSANMEVCNDTTYQATNPVQPSVTASPKPQVFTFDFDTADQLVFSVGKATAATTMDVKPQTPVSAVKHAKSPAGSAKKQKIATPKVATPVTIQNHTVDRVDDADVFAVRTQSAA